MAKYYLVINLVIAIAVLGVLLANRRLRFKLPKKNIAPVHKVRDRSKPSKIDIRI